MRSKLAEAVWWLILAVVTVTMFIAAFVLISGCAADVDTATDTVDAQQISEVAGVQIPEFEIIRAAVEIYNCTDKPLDLRVYDAAGYTAKETKISPCTGNQYFDCPTGVVPECGPVPVGFTEETCPCRCSGVADPVTMQFVVTENKAALKHELIHLGYNMFDHDGDVWECQ